MSDKARYQIVRDLLAQHYGYPQWRQHLPPEDELVSTILSQATSDGNRDKGFYALKARFPTWEAVRDAPVEAVEEAIRPAGLSRQKAPRIQAALRYITEKVGRVDLSFLKDMPTEEAKAWLTAIDGVGPKTAAIILLFCFNQPAFPVDTHVHRVNQRLGFVDKRMGPDRAHPIMEALAEPADYYADHLNFIRHGREVCRSMRPACGRCFLSAHCHYFQQEQEKAK